MWKSQKYKSPIEKRHDVNVLVESQGVTEHFGRGQHPHSSELWSLWCWSFSWSSVQPWVGVRNWGLSLSGSSLSAVLVQFNYQSVSHKMLSCFRLESTCSFASLPLLRKQCGDSLTFICPSIFRGVFGRNQRNVPLHIAHKYPSNFQVKSKVVFWYL